MPKLEMGSMMNRGKVLCTYALDDDEREYLEKEVELVYKPSMVSSGEIFDLVKDCEGYLNFHSPIDEEFLDAAPKLRIVSNVGVGYNTFDINGMRRRGIIGTHTPYVLDVTVSDLIITLMLATARRVAELDSAVRAGKARYVGISSYGPERTEEAAEILRTLGTPLLIHQPSYSMFNRWIERELLDVLDEEGVGCIAFSPLAQGLLTDKYLRGVPEDSRVRSGNYFSQNLLSDENLERARALNELAQRRGQSLAQMAIAWVLRDPRVTSALVGVSSVRQLENNLAALERLDFDAEELAEIDRYAQDGQVNIWAQSSQA